MPEPVTPPAGGQPPAPTPPAPEPPAGGQPPAGAQDPIAIAKELGEIKAERDLLKKEYGEYRQKADPVLETLWSDSELLKKAQEVHKRRLGGQPPAPAAPTPPGGQPPAPPMRDTDTRNAMINTISSDFENKTGISKLPAEKQQDVRGKVGQMLLQMLDPNGNKTITQVLEDVSLTKLPWYMEKAYQLINRENDLSAAEERGKNTILAEYQGDAGIIGGIPGGSVPIDQMTLTPQERKVAKNMGISEEKYLANKKALAEFNG